MELSKESHTPPLDNVPARICSCLAFAQPVSIINEKGQGEGFIGEEPCMMGKNGKRSSQAVPGIGEK